MIHCITEKCKYRKTCMTAIKQDEECEEIKLPTPKYTDRCEYYYNIKETEEAIMLDHEFLLDHGE